MVYRQSTLHKQLIAAVLVWVMAFMAFMQPKPAEAMVPVFDGANWINTLRQLASDTIRNKNQLTIIYELIEQYRYLMTDGHIDINLIWADIQPALDHSIDVLSKGDVASMKEANLIRAFQDAFPQFTPNQPYADIMNLYRDYQQETVRNTLQYAQAIQKANHEEQTTTYRSLIHQLNAAQSKQGILQAIGHMMYAMLQGQSMQTQAFSGFESQAIKFQYELAAEQHNKDAAQRNSAPALVQAMLDTKTQLDASNAKPLPSPPPGVTPAWLKAPPPPTLPPH